jgi:hypothetical protein
MSRTSRTVSLALATVLTVLAGLAGPASTGAAPAGPQAAIPLPHDDPFYRYTGTKPLDQIPRGTVLKSRAVTLGMSTRRVRPRRGWSPT